MQNVFRTNDAMIEPIKKIMQEQEIREKVEKEYLLELGTYSKKAIPADKMLEFNEEVEKRFTQALKEGLPWDKEKTPVEKAVEKSALPGTDKTSMGFGVKINPPERGLGSPDAINNLSKTTVKSPPDRPISTNRPNIKSVVDKVDANDSYRKPAPIVKANSTKDDPYVKGFSASKMNNSNTTAISGKPVSKTTPTQSADADERGGETRKDLAKVAAIHGNKKLSAFGKAFQTARLAQGQKPALADKSTKPGTFMFKGKKYTTVRKDEMTEEEDLQELSKKTLGSYVKKAKDKLFDAGWDFSATFNKPGKLDPKVDTLSHVINKRYKGINKAVDKLMKEDDLQELSKKTLGSYIKKASDNLVDIENRTQLFTKLANDSVDANMKRKWEKKADRSDRKYLKRGDGIDRAVDRLTGEKKTPKTPFKLYVFKKSLQESGPTRKHFQMAADTIKTIEDPEKRKEHAKLHADLYSQQNKRFDRNKFMKACNVDEDEDKMTEKNLQELSKKTLGSYIKKASNKLHTLQRSWPKDSSWEAIVANEKIDKKKRLTINNKKTGIERAANKMIGKQITPDEYIEKLRKSKEVNEEDLQELSKKTLGSYIKKASKDFADRSYHQGNDDGRETEIKMKKRRYREDPDYRGERGNSDEKIDNRDRGISKAVDRLSGKMKRKDKSYFSTYSMKENEDDFGSYYKDDGNGNYRLVRSKKSKKENEDDFGSYYKDDGNGNYRRVSKNFNSYYKDDGNGNYRLVRSKKGGSVND